MGRDNNNGKVRHTVQKPETIEEIIKTATCTNPGGKVKHTIEGHGHKGTGSSRSEAEKNWRKSKGKKPKS